MSLDDKKLDAAIAMCDASASFSAVKKELSGLGMTIKDNRDFDEFIVNFYNGGSEASAYYTNDLDDALKTGRDMARRRAGGKDKEKKADAEEYPPEESDKAYKKDKEAAKRGELMSKNPYRDGTDAASSWAMGFSKAKGWDRGNKAN